MKRVQNPRAVVVVPGTNLKKDDKVEPTNKGMFEEEKTEDKTEPAAVCDEQHGKENDGEEGVRNPQVAEPVLPVHTLLEEIGLKIFENLDDNDVASSFTTFPSWNHWSMPTRSRFLFPKVAQFLLQWLPNNTLLECRKVCKTWKKALDNEYPLRPELLQDGYHLGLVCRFSAFAVNEIQRFMEEMDHLHPGNPFFSRTISLIVREDSRVIYGESGMHFWNNVNRLLDRFGEHIHFAQIQLCENHLIPVEQALENCLRRLPNLKRLEIDGISFPEAGRIHEYYRVHPLPQLIHLQTLKLNSPDDINNAVLNSCCVPLNIKQLCIRTYEISRFYEAVYQFRNLEVLDTMKIMSFEEFEQLMHLSLRLKKVFLYIHNIEDPHVNFQRVFTTLQILADSLESADVLTTGLKTVFRMDVGNDFKINLPKLKRLSLLGYEGPFDPFLELKSLNHLDITFFETWEQKWFENQIETSNIMTLLPSLKTLTMHGMDSRDFFESEYKRNTAGQISNQFKVIGRLDEFMLRP